MYASKFSAPNAGGIPWTCKPVRVEVAPSSPLYSGHPGIQSNVLTQSGTVNSPNSKAAASAKSADSEESKKAVNNYDDVDATPGPLSAPATTVAPKPVRKGRNEPTCPSERTMRSSRTALLNNAVAQGTPAATVNTPAIPAPPAHALTPTTTSAQALPPFEDAGRVILKIRLPPIGKTKTNVSLSTTKGTGVSAVAPEAASHESQESPALVLAQIVRHSSRRGKRSAEVASLPEGKEGAKKRKGANIATASPPSQELLREEQRKAPETIASTTETADNKTGRPIKSMPRARRSTKKTETTVVDVVYAAHLTVATPAAGAAASKKRTTRATTTAAVGAAASELVIETLEDKAAIMKGVKPRNGVTTAPRGKKASVAAVAAEENGSAPLGGEAVTAKFDTGEKGNARATRAAPAPKAPTAPKATKNALKTTKTAHETKKNAQPKGKSRSGKEPTRSSNRLDKAKRREEERKELEEYAQHGAPAQETTPLERWGNQADLVLAALFHGALPPAVQSIQISACLREDTEQRRWARQTLHKVTRMGQEIAQLLDDQHREAQICSIHREVQGL